MNIAIAYSVVGAAEAVGVGEDAIRRAIHAGDLKAKRQNKDSDGNGTGKFLIKVCDLEAWFDGLVDA